MSAKTWFITGASSGFGTTFASTPLRLQLGPDAVDAIRGHSQTLLNEAYRAWEAPGRSTSFSSSAG